MKIRVHRRHESGVSNADESFKQAGNWKLNSSAVIEQRHLNNSFSQGDRSDMHKVTFKHTAPADKTKNNSSQSNSITIKDTKESKNTKTITNDKVNNTKITTQSLERALKGNFINTNGVSSSSNTIPLNNKTISRYGQQLPPDEMLKAAFLGDSQVYLDHFPKHLSNSHNHKTSSLTTIAGLGAVDGDDVQLSIIERQKLYPKIVSMKQRMNQSADIETQLVKLEENYPTENDQVNPKKVTEIIQSIQRKYRQRKDLKGLFERWDEEGKGQLNSKNVYSMLNRMGINVNMREAAMIMQSAKNQAGQTEQLQQSDDLQQDSLNTEQFLQLIFNENGSTGTANRQIQKGQSRVRSMTLDDNSQNNKNSLAQEVIQIQNPQALRSVSHENQQSNKIMESTQGVRVVLKNKMKELFRNFLIVDFERKGQIDAKALTQILRRKVDIQKSVVSDEDIEQLISTYSMKSNSNDAKQNNNNFNNNRKFDYRQFTSDLKNYFCDQTGAPINVFKDKQRFHSSNLFCLQEDKSLGSKLEKHLTSKVNALLEERLKGTDDDREGFNFKDVVIGDIQLDNPAHSDIMKARAQRVARRLQKIFKTKDCLGDILAQNEQNVKNIDAIHKDQLMQGIVNAFKSVGQQITQKDLEAFLHVPIYNQQGYTETKQLNDILFDENPIQMYTRVSRRVRAVPPTLHAVAEEERDQISNEGNTKELTNLLGKVENKLFFGNRDTFKVFREFDADKDGYVDVKSISSRMRSAGVLKDDREQAQLEGYLRHKDTNSNKTSDHLTVSQFSQKLSGVPESGKDRAYNLFDVDPSNQRNILQNRIAAAKQSSQFITSERNALKATVDITSEGKHNNQQGLQVRSTQQLNPQMQSTNTTSNISYTMRLRSYTNNPIAIQESSAMYSSDAERFKISGNHTQLQLNDKQRRDNYLQGRLENHRVNANIIASKAAMFESQAEKRDQANVQAASIQQLVYQKLAERSNHIF